jgi:hypothetical protein
MSREVIAELESALSKVLVRYETEYEVTAAEVCGILGILQADRQLRAILPHCVNEIKEILGEPVLSHSGPPTGEIVTLEGNEPGEMNHGDYDD